jgi:hypothetical protein
MQSEQSAVRAPARLRDQRDLRRLFDLRVMPGWTNGESR